jgi:hypothetical protein
LARREWKARPLFNPIWDIKTVTTPDGGSRNELHLKKGATESPQFQLLVDAVISAAREELEWGRRSPGKKFGEDI